MELFYINFLLLGLRTLYGRRLENPGQSVVTRALLTPPLETMVRDNAKKFCCRESQAGF